MLSAVPSTDVTAGVSRAPPIRGAHPSSVGICRNRARSAPLRGPDAAQQHPVHVERRRVAGLGDRMRELVLVVRVDGHEHVALDHAVPALPVQDHAGALVRGSPRGLRDGDDRLVGHPADESGAVRDDVGGEPARDHVVRAYAGLRALGLRDLQELGAGVPRVQYPPGLVVPVHRTSHLQQDPGADAGLLGHVLVPRPALEHLHALPGLQDRPHGLPQGLVRVRYGALDPHPQDVPQIHQVPGVRARLLQRPDLGLVPHGDVDEQVRRAGGGLLPDDRSEQLGARVDAQGPLGADEDVPGRRQVRGARPREDAAVLLREPAHLPVVQVYAAERLHEVGCPACAAYRPRRELRYDVPRGGHYGHHHGRDLVARDPPEAVEVEDPAPVESDGSARRGHRPRVRGDLVQVHGVDVERREPGGDLDLGEPPAHNVLHDAGDLLVLEPHPVHLAAYGPHGIGRRRGGDVRVVPLAETAGHHQARRDHHGAALDQRVRHRDHGRGGARDPHAVALAHPELGAVVLVQKHGGLGRVHVVAADGEPHSGPSGSSAISTSPTMRRTSSIP